MPAYTDVQICSMASLLVGGHSFAAFSERPEGEICESIYEMVKKAILSTHNWHFARNKVQLSQSVDSPSNQWTYQYVLPSDRLENGMIKVFRTDTPMAPEFKDWEIVGNYLMTDADEIHVEYLVDVDESVMPTWFVQLLVRAIMAEIVLPIKRSAEERKLLQDEVYGEGGILERCRRADTRNNPNPVMQDFPIHDARFTN